MSKKPDVYFTSAGKLAQLFVWLCRFKGRQFAEWLFHSISQPTIMSRSFCGFKLYLDISRTVAHKLLFLEGERFVSERGILAGLAKPGNCIIDVGANIGYYMLLFRKMVGEKGRVICFEPEPSNFAEIDSNIKNNSLMNVDLTQAAVGMMSGKTSFSCGLNGMVQPNGSGDLDVEMVPLDLVITEKVDLIKIDVEGYEAYVLKGAEILIERFHPALFLEVHPHLLAPGFSVNDIIEFLSKYYTDITFYETKTLSLLEKILSRYVHDKSIGKATNREILLSQTSNVFWVVCKPVD